MAVQSNIATTILSSTTNKLKDRKNWDPKQKKLLRNRFSGRNATILCTSLNLQPQPEQYRNNRSVFERSQSVRIM